MEPFLTLLHVQYSTIGHIGPFENTPLGTIGSMITGSQCIQTTRNQTLEYVALGTLRTIGTVIAARKWKQHEKRPYPHQSTNPGTLKNNENSRHPSWHIEAGPGSHNSMQKLGPGFVIAVPRFHQEITKVTVGLKTCTAGTSRQASFLGGGGRWQAWGGRALFHMRSTCTTLRRAPNTQPGRLCQSFTDWKLPWRWLGNW